MSDERRRDEVPAYGRVGPADPTADPVTHPALRVPGGEHAEPDPADDDQPTVALPGPSEPAEPDTERPTTPTRVRSGGPWSQHSRVGGWWVGLVLSAAVGVLLLVFILQNTDPVRITFLWLTGTLPTGIALLFGAIAGILLVAIPGTLRILQLRRASQRR